MDDRKEASDRAEGTDPRDDKIAARLEAIRHDLELALEDLEAAAKDRRKVIEQLDELDD